MDTDARTPDGATDFRSEHVTLRGGPCDGLRVPATVNSPWRFSRPLLMEDRDDPEVVARYRPSREKDVYTFRGMDRVVAHERPRAGCRLRACLDMKAERDRLREALVEIHDYHCGCAHPGDLTRCVCEPVSAFEVLYET